MFLRARAARTRLNTFADAYNAYVLALKSGERGIDKWKRVERAWERLK